MKILTSWSLGVPTSDAARCVPVVGTYSNSRVLRGVLPA